MMPKPMKTNRSSSSGRRIFVWGGTRKSSGRSRSGWRTRRREIYHRMTIGWAELRRLFQNDPWGAEGPTGTRAKMAFMAAYNVDRFREFVFGSSFLKRFTVKPELLNRIKKDDAQLMLLGFDWIKLFLWGIRSRRLKPKGR